MSKAFRLGLFVVGTLSILGGGVFLIGDKQMLLHRTTRVKADFDNVAGLNEGASVRVGGIREGTVHHLNLPKNPTGKVTVEMDVERGAMELVKQDSIASIKSEGLLGDKYVEVTIGSSDAGALKSGGSIQGEPPVDISDMIKKTDEILETTKHAVQNANETTQNLKSVTDKIDTGKGTIGALINDKSIFNEAKAGATAFHDDANALKHNFLTRGFFKDRGYEDSADLTKNQVAALPKETPLKTFNMDAKKLFDKPDTAKLKNEKLLADVGKFLESQNTGTVVVAASTSPKGETDKQQKLSDARAYVVRKYLAENFRVDDTRIRTMGTGKGTSEDGTLQIFVYADKSVSESK